MEENILKIPYAAVRNDWDLLQQFLKMKGNPKYVIVGDVNLRERKDISDLGNLVGVMGYLNLGESSIQSLGDLEFVDGDLYLSKCDNIKTLGKLKKVEGDLSLWSSSIESLGELEFVGDDLNLSYCENIKTLGKLKRVEAELCLNESSIESLGELEYVNMLSIRKTKIPRDEINKLHVDGRIFR
jgi:hypothetical protein